MSAAKKGQGGLIALSVHEATALITALLLMDPQAEVDKELLVRLREWRARHVRAGVIDGD